MSVILCPICKAKTRLNKDKQSPTGWTCSKCKVHCIREKTIKNKEIKALNFAFQENTEEILSKNKNVNKSYQNEINNSKKIKKSIKKRRRQLSLFD